ncbi:MAG: glutamine synthetase family protein, partial [Candidatus Competibacterales bacterium]|nr:glutamine synthetase family protein [Candidatus Competibacterales bacterium]
MAEAAAAELAEFAAAHPEIEAIDLLLPDLNGLLRGKRIRCAALEKLYRDGLALPASVFAATITGDTVESTGLGFDEGDADRLCRPVLGSLRPMPWQSRPLAQLLLTMHEADGRPFFADPRQILTRVLDGFRDWRLTPVVALELEFYLIDSESSADGRPRPPVSPLTRIREHQTQVYGVAELEAFDPILEDILAAAAAQEIPADTLIAEYAPGQYEINLRHQADALRACDHAVQLRRLIKAVARRHGLAATFMAKPYTDQTGSGMHVHVSLEDDRGLNLFAATDPLGSPLLGQAAAGMLAVMAEGMALFAPGANAFRRFQPETYVPLSPVWGSNNRTLALRVPSGDPSE